MGEEHAGRGACGERSSDWDGGRVGCTVGWCGGVEESEGRRIGLVLLEIGEFKCSYYWDVIFASNNQIQPRQ